MIIIFYKILPTNNKPKIFLTDQPAKELRESTRK